MSFLLLKRNNFLSRYSFVLVTTLILLILDAATLVKPYLWADSISWIAKQEALFSIKATEQVLQNLRPAYAFYLELTRLWISTTGDLRLPNLLAILGGVFFSIQLRNTLLKCGDSKKFSSVVAIASLMLPTFQNYLFDTIMWPMLFTTGLVLKAYTSVSEGNSMFYVILCLTLVNLTYQPLFSLFLFFIFYSIYKSQPKDVSVLWHTLLKTRRYWLVFILSFALSTAISLFTLKFAGSTLSDRTAVISNTDELRGKLYWILSTISATFLRPFAVNTQVQFVVFSSSIGILLSILILKDCWCKKPRNLLGSLMIPLGGLISIYPVLVVAQNQFEFRSVPGLCIASVIWAAKGLELVQRKTNSSRNVNTLTVRILLTFFILNGFFLSRESWVIPSQSRDTVLSNAKVISPIACIVLPKLANERLDRLGIYSLRTDLVLSWVSSNLNISKSGTAIIKSIVEDREKCEENQTVLDFSDAFNKHPRKWLY